MNISYAITVKDELFEISNLIGQLLHYKRDSDEIVILYDSKNGSKEVEEYLRAQNVEKSKFRWYPYAFNNDFSEMKNYLNSMCTKDYIFNIDADESPTDALMTSILEILTLNNSVEAYAIPRWNVVRGVTDEYIKEMNWNMDQSGRINWPDFQIRLYKRSDKIKWESKVHERLVGFDQWTHLPYEGGVIWYLDHIKSMDRQKKQNDYYKTLS